MTTISIQHLQKYLKNSKSNSNTLVSDVADAPTSHTSLVLGPTLLARHDNMVFKRCKLCYMIEIVL